MSKFNLDGHKLGYHTDRVHTFLDTGDCVPLYMEISPVGTCNHRCIFCAYDYIGYPNRKLDTQKLKSFLSEIGRVGVRSILLAGEGEPLLHPDIGPIIGHAFDQGIDVGLFTNGQLLDRELAEEILPKLTFIRFSFNSGDRENYAQVHQVKPAIFDRVLQNIAQAAKIKQDHGLNVDIGTQYVLLPENSDFLIDAATRLKQAGVDYMAIKPFVQQSGQQGYQMNEPLDPDGLGGLFAAAEQLSSADFTVIARKEAFAGYGERTYRHCYGTSFISVVTSGGDVGSCLPYWDEKDFILGNIYTHSFQEIWQSADRVRIKSRLEQNMNLSACPPNCRPHAVNQYLFELKHPTIKHINFI